MSPALDTAKINFLDILISSSALIEHRTAKAAAGTHARNNVREIAVANLSRDRFSAVTIYARANVRADNGSGCADNIERTRIDVNQRGRVALRIYVGTYRGGTHPGAGRLLVVIVIVAILVVVAPQRTVAASGAVRSLVAQEGTGVR